MPLTPFDTMTWADAMNLSVQRHEVTLMVK